MHHKTILAFSLCLTAAFTAGSCKRGGGSGGDGSGPKVVGTNPAQNTASVTIASIMEFIFNESLDETTVNNSSVTLEAPGGVLDSSVLYNDAALTATLTPTEGLALAAEHTARVTTAVKDRAGNPLEAEFALQFRTQDGTLGAAELFENEAVRNSSIVSAKSNSQGRGFVLWQQSTATQDTILFVTPFDFDSDFGTPLALVTGRDVFAGLDSLQINSHGDAIVVWSQRTDSHAPVGVINSADKESVFARIFSSQSGIWDPAQPVDSTNTLDANRPTAQLDDSGNALVLWSQQAGFFDPADLLVRRYTAVGGWEPGIPLETETGETSGEILAMNANGQAVATWSQEDVLNGSKYSAHARIFDPQSGWGPSELIETQTAGSAFVRQLAVWENGNAMVAWEQRNAFPFGDESPFTNYYIAGLGWQGEEEAAPADNDTSHIELKLDGAGNAFLVWYQYFNPQHQIFARRFVPGSGWEAAHTVSGTKTNPIGFSFSLDVNSNGQAIVAWAQSASGVGFHVFASEFDPQTAWTAPTELSDEVESGSFPQAALDRNGNAIVAWRQRIDGSSPINEDGYYNRYVRGVGWAGPQFFENTGELLLSLFVLMDKMGRAMLIYVAREDLGASQFQTDIWFNAFR